MTNPLEDYLKSKETTKTAGFLDQVGKGVSSDALGGAARTMLPAAILGGGLAMLSGAAGNAYRAIMKGSHFKSMLRANPDLDEANQTNPDQFERHYNALYSMNPHFASEPTVAGAYMRQMSMHPATAGKVVVESLSSLPDRPQGPKLQIGGQMKDNDLHSSAQVTHNLF